MLSITEEFKVTKAEVFNAWATAENMALWWGPAGFTTEVKNFEFEPKGRFHYVIKDGKGMEMWGLFTYQQIVKPSQLIFINSFSNEDGEVVRAPEIPFGKHWPLQMLNTLTFTENEGKTVLKMTIEPFEASPEEIDTFSKNTENVRMGFQGTFAQLQDFLNQ